MNSADFNGWPELPRLADWSETLETVHMWSQVLGKVRLVQSPWINHSWGSALYVTPRGLTSSLIPYEGRDGRGGQAFSIDFDFVDHALRMAASDGQSHSFALEPMSVADFYEKTMRGLGEMGIRVSIFTRPVEVVTAIPFEEDTTHASYDGDAMQRFWGALVQSHRVFSEFRAKFVGKVSPVHFFWGAFDLAVTRFSGRRAPRHPGGAPNCADWVMEEAYSHEVSSAGFWPGTGFGEAAYYSYAYPGPEGFERAPVKPAGASWLSEMGEFVLPYTAVREADDPDGALLAFLESTYAAAADLGKWDRGALEKGGG